MPLILYLLLLIGAVNCATPLDNVNKLSGTSRVCFKGTLLKGENEYIHLEVLVDEDDKNEICAVKWHVSKTNELIKVESTALPTNELMAWNKRKCGWVGEENDNFIFVTTSNLTGSNSRMWTKAARFPECFDIDGDSDVGPSGWKEALGAIMYDGYETITKVNKKLRFADGKLLKYLASITPWDPFDYARTANEDGICLKGTLYNSSNTEKNSAKVIKYSLSLKECVISWTIPVKNGEINGSVIAEGDLEDALKGEPQKCDEFFVLKDTGNYIVTMLVKNEALMDWKLAATEQECFIPEENEKDLKIQKLWLQAIAAAKDTELDLEDYNWVMQVDRVQQGREILKARERPIATTTEPSVASNTDGKKNDGTNQGSLGLDGSTEQMRNNGTHPPTKYPEWWLVPSVMSGVVLAVLVIAVVAVLLNKASNRKENSDKGARSTRSDYGRSSMMEVSMKN